MAEHSSETPHVLIVESPYYQDIAEALAKGAIAELERTGATHDRVSVPGAFEIPAAIRCAIAGGEATPGQRRYDAYIALGCVIRGETSHYDHICSECARGLMDLSVRHAIALGFGVLTCENRQQAWARASVDEGNKGADAARAALAMAKLRQHFGLTS